MRLQIGAASLVLSLGTMLAACSPSDSGSGSPDATQSCTPAPSDVVDNLNAGAEASATITSAFIEDGGPYDPGFGEGYTTFSYVAAAVQEEVAVWAVTYQGSEIAVTLPMNDHARGVNITGRDVSPGAPIYAGINGPSDEAYTRAVACAEGT